MDSSPGTILTRRNAIIVITALTTTVAFLVGVFLFSIFTSPTPPAAQKLSSASLANNVNVAISPTAAPTIQKLASPVSTPAKSDATTKKPQPTKEVDLKIKGNRNSGIYHLPGCASYSRTKNNVEWFKTEEAAIAAGYRKAENCWR